MGIQLVTQIKVFDKEPRHRKRCSCCDRVRLCTRTRVQVRKGSFVWDEFFCNECLTDTPNWTKEHITES